MEALAVVSAHKWAVKVHAAASEMTVKPGTYRTLCGWSWHQPTGQNFEQVAPEQRCERCSMMVAAKVAA